MVYNFTSKTMSTIKVKIWGFPMSFTLLFSLTRFLSSLDLSFKIKGPPNFSRYIQTYENPQPLLYVQIILTLLGTRCWIVWRENLLPVKLLNTDDGNEFSSCPYLSINQIQVFLATGNFFSSLVYQSLYQVSLRTCYKIHLFSSEFGRSKTVTGWRLDFLLEKSFSVVELIRLFQLSNPIKCFVKLTFEWEGDIKM